MYTQYGKLYKFEHNQQCVLYNQLRNVCYITHSTQAISHTQVATVTMLQYMPQIYQMCVQQNCMRILYFESPKICTQKHQHIIINICTANNNKFMYIHSYICINSQIYIEYTPQIHSVFMVIIGCDLSQCNLHTIVDYATINYKLQYYNRVQTQRMLLQQSFRYNKLFLLNSKNSNTNYLNCKNSLKALFFQKRNNTWIFN
eukprot:TRINITY_DN7307_c0_g3_i1.p2 TRINITY_DN7307_c0_g3~~TRINITY_DN7307_c0_g3_i1.p2  ORF type:complete len:201 (-),score=-24.80 TRINITY_DN7307_c0_g3_i1:187-789(-)